MIRVYYLDTQITDNIESIIGQQYIHHALIDMEGTLRKVIQNTSDKEHNALIALAFSWREPTAAELNGYATIPSKQSKFKFLKLFKFW